MERDYTPRENDVLQLAAAQFGADARFTYINREKRQIVTLTLAEALDACKYIVDESNDEVMRVLEKMHAETEKVDAFRRAKLAQRAVNEGQV